MKLFQPPTEKIISKKKKGNSHEKPTAECNKQETALWHCTTKEYTQPLCLKNTAGKIF